MIDSSLPLAVDIKIHDLYGKRIIFLCFFKDDAQIPPRSFGKALICIEEDDPIACRMGKRLVSCCRKIVMPRTSKELCLGNLLYDAARIIL